MTSRLALCAVLSSLAACAEGVSDANVPAPAPDGGDVATAHVEIETNAQLVSFAGPDGAPVTQVAVEDGVADADVPLGSSAIAALSIGEIVDGGARSTLRTFTGATALADGDVVALPGDAPADHLPVVAALPAAPPDAPIVTLYWCGGSTVLSAGTTRFEFAGNGCGPHMGALLVASATAGGAPMDAILVPDLGLPPGIDLQARAWQPIADVAVTIAPVPANGETWTVRGGAILDGAFVPLGDELAADGAQATVAAFTGGAVLATVDRPATLAGAPAVHDELAYAIGRPRELDIDVDALPFPSLQAYVTGPRSFALGGDVDAVRDELTIRATLFGAGEIDQYALALGGHADTFTLPAAAGTADDLALSQLELVLADASADHVWTRRLSYEAP